MPPWEQYQNAAFLPQTGAGKPWEKYQMSASPPQTGAGKPWEKYQSPDNISTNDNKPLASVGEVLEPAIETAKALPAFGAAKIGGYKDLAAEDAKKELLTMRKREPGVDYDTGLSLGAETAYRRADNPMEQFKALKKSFPTLDLKPIRRAIGS